MLIKIKKSAQPREIKMVRELLERAHLGHRVIDSRNETFIGVESSPSEEISRELTALSAVESATPIQTPYKLASLAAHPEKTVIRIGNIEIGGEAVILMAGPCAIESQEQLEAVAEGLKGTGVSVLRASAYKPRTSPYSFQGMGEAGLKLHAQAKAKHGLLIETEVMDVRDVALVAAHVDIIRIGARNMQNFDLLKEVGKCGKPVILKRGMSSTIEEWLMSAEYIIAHGNPEVILCERGIRTFENATRSTLDLSSIPVLKRLTHLPVIVDPSHAAGRKDLIPSLSAAAIAAGADGLLVEVHANPKKAKCDGKQALLPVEWAELVAQLRKVAIAMGRSI
jgi:3-deoxy-7-phosphoheptulonate synthase